MHQTTQLPPNSTQTVAVGDVAAAPNLGDNVMQILADVEGQLSRLRDVQKTQDDAILSLAERAKMLREAEDEIEQSRSELAKQKQLLEQDRLQLQSQQSAFEAQCAQSQKQWQQQQAELAQSRAKLEQQHSEFASQQGELQQRQQELQQSLKNWEQQRTLHELELSKRHGELEQRATELARLQGEFDAERKSVETLRQECSRQQQEFDARSVAMEKEHAELLHRVEQAEKNVGELIQKAEESNRQLAAKSDELKQSINDAEQFQRRAALLEQSLHQANERADQLERDSVELARLADGERVAVEKKLDAATAQLHETKAARDAAQQQLQGITRRAAELEQHAETLQTQLDEQRAQFADSQQKLELAGRKLSEFAKVLSEQTPQLERGAAAIAMVDEQQDQIDRLTKQLAEHKLRSDPEEMLRRDQRITQLTEALRQARGQAAGQQGIAELEQRNAELTAEVDQLKIEVENAQLVAEQLQQQLEERVDAESSPTVHDATLAEHAARVAALTAELEQLRDNAAAELKSKLAAQAKQHKKELAKSHHTDAAAVQAMRDRIKELEEELRIAQFTSNAAVIEDDQSQFAQKLRDKAERVTAVAEHLRRRRTRLEKMRRWMQQKAMSEHGSPHGGMRSEEVLKLEQERAQLAEARQALTVAERRMVRKWAGHKAVLTAACVFILAIICAVGGWMVADRIAPAEISASVVLEAKTPQRAPMSAEEAASWREWHIDVLSDSNFQESLARRMAERRLDAYASPAKLTQRLQQDLTVDAQLDGRMVLTLAGTNRDEITAMLDVIAAAVAMESSRQMTKRADNATTIVSGERREGGQVRFAAVNQVPIRDDRLSYALPIFALLLASSLATIFFVYTKLVKAKRVFDEDSAAAVALE